MALITHHWLHFLPSHSHPLPSSVSPSPSFTLYSFLVGLPAPPPTTHTHCLLCFYSFPTSFPSLRYWARLQVLVGGQSNYIETLRETKKIPCVMSWMTPTSAVSFHLFVPQSQQETMSSLSVSFLPCQVIDLWEAQCSPNTAFQTSTSISLRRG